MTDQPISRPSPGAHTGNLASDLTWDEDGELAIGQGCLGDRNTPSSSVTLVASSVIHHHGRQHFPFWLRWLC